MGRGCGRGVPETIDKLRKAGIKVWSNGYKVGVVGVEVERGWIGLGVTRDHSQAEVLTGDKQVQCRKGMGHFSF